MSGAWPAAFTSLRPGLNDDGVDELREAVAPYLLSSQIEALYRWRDGGDQGVFGGWRMRPLEELIRWYRFTVDKLQSPRSWLPIFDDQIVNIVTLDLPGEPRSDTSVWYGHTHDGWLARMFDSIAALLNVVCDAAEENALVESNGRLSLPNGDYGESLDGHGWSRLRLARSPGGLRHPEPPPGTELSRSPNPSWPREWLLPLGVTDESLTLRGATHTIAQLVAAAAEAPAQGTIRGRVVTGMSIGGDWWNPVVDDGTGRIVVCCNTALIPISVGCGSEGEFDVVLKDISTPEPSAHPNPQVAGIADRLLQTDLPRATATGARLISAEAEA